MTTTRPTAYAIRVDGHLDDHWSGWFGGLVLARNSDGTSTLAGPVADQAQLHGMLAGLRDIGATLLELRATAGTPTGAPGPVLDRPLRTERLTLRPTRAEDAGSASGHHELVVDTAHLDGPPGPARIIDLYRGYMMSQTLFAAVEVGLFAAAGPEPATPAELAGRCGIPQRSARAMADLLADAGLLERDGAAFRTAPDAEAFLTGRGPVDLRPMARYWATVSYPAWGDAVEAFRTRRGVRPVLDKAQTEAYESTVALVTAETAADLARTYDFGRHRRLLDVGGGYGTFVKPILTAYANLTATLIDLPEVASAVADQAIPRLTAIGADVFASPLPPGHDVILVANLVHLLPPDRIAELFRRLRAAAAPGTTLLLVDWWRTDRAPHPSARFGAGEFLVISGGDLYQVDEVAGWLAETGWRHTGLTALPPPSGVIEAVPA